MRKILVVAVLLMLAAIADSRTPTTGNMFNVSDYSGTYGLEVNTDGSVVPMTTSSSLGNATYPWTAATITTLGVTTNNATTTNSTTANVTTLNVGGSSYALHFKGISNTATLKVTTPALYDVYYNTDTYKLYVATGAVACGFKASAAFGATD